MNDTDQVRHYVRLIAACESTLAAPGKNLMGIRHVHAAKLATLEVELASEKPCLRHSSATARPWGCGRQLRFMLYRLSLCRNRWVNTVFWNPNLMKFT